jgi:hypothetical protein
MSQKTLGAQQLAFSTHIFLSYAISIKDTDNIFIGRELLKQEKETFSSDIVGAFLDLWQGKAHLDLESDPLYALVKQGIFLTAVFKKLEYRQITADTFLKFDTASFAHSPSEEAALAFLRFLTCPKDKIRSDDIKQGSPLSIVVLQKEEIKEIVRNTDSDYVIKIGRSGKLGKSQVDALGNRISDASSSSQEQKDPGAHQVNRQ